METVRPLIEQRRHELVADVPSSKSCVLGDETRLSQVFINLLNNAAKYTPSGGRIELTLATSEDHATVRISDSGIGIDASKLSNVFDMFTQIENRLEREQSGLGVGLALSKRMVELHEGSIEASSCGVGLGSTFTVRLPLISSGAVNAEEKPQLASSIAQRRVLLVDDNVEYALSLSMILGSLGHDVKVAHDGPTALNIVSEWRPDFACLDIGMPGMSGYELARRLRASSGCAEIMLIAITGWGQERDREMAKQAGFDHHLVKPVHSEAIVALMEKTAVSGTVNEAATVASGERL
jgi:CheY-like chemotaxis protein